jgi:hypothetical protein
MPEVESCLSGRVPTAKLIWDAGKLLADRTIAITGRRPSIIYKEFAIQGLLVRMLHPLVTS